MMARARRKTGPFRLSKKRRAQHRAYKQSAKGLARYRRHDSTPHGIERKERYAYSGHGMITLERARVRRNLASTRARIATLTAELADML